MSYPPLNLPLFDRIKAHITAHPDQFDMNSWWTVGSCGTACCIAGWACALDELTVMPLGFGSLPRPTDKGIALAAVCKENSTAASELARMALGLTHAEAARLFYDHRWPDHLQTMDDRAVAACLMIDEIIADREDKTA